MDRVQRLTQAYYQTPWRKQLQGIGLFLAVLVILSLIAGIYLNVTARATTIGRQMQYDHYDKENLQLEIKDYQAQLAYITSAVEMERRALEMGFVPATSEEIMYLLIPEYPGRAQITLAPDTQTFVPAAPTLSPEFTQSLFEWLQSQFSIPAVSFGVEMP